jgi:cyclopropane fatty-acyl-phospholipid synthase-like methyltransferase
MPYSDDANKPWATEKIKEVNPHTVLDVGAGAGAYLDIIRQNIDHQVTAVAVEVWEPYILEFNLTERYDKVLNEDVRGMEDFNYDLVIFGDVLEHMSEEDAINLWDKVSKQAKFALISIPIIHLPQDAYAGNPYEVHVEEDWNSDRVRRAFHSIIDSRDFEVTGVFLAKFDNEHLL